MPDRAPGHNPTRRGGLPRRLLLAACAVLWLLTMAQVLRSEVLEVRESADVRALVESARLTRQHASARYVIRLGVSEVGSLSSSVSGGPREEQLAYVLEGELEAPIAARLRGAVLASWDRRPERFVLEVFVADQRHRVEGTMRRDDGEELFHVRYLAPGAPPEDAAAWVLPDVPRLAPGPLPVPEFEAHPFAEGRSGALPDPLTGDAQPWSLEPMSWESMTLAGTTRRVRRHVLRYGDLTATAWTEASGFPVRVELPPSIVIELAEEGR